MNKKLKWNKWTILTGIFLLIAIASISSFFYYEDALKSPSNSDAPVYFKVVEGDSVSSVVERLAKDGLIKNVAMTKINAKLNGVDRFDVGSYQIHRDWSSPKMLKYLSNVKNIMKDEVLLTFKEGIWAKDIAKIIEENTNVKAEELIALWNDEAFLKACIEGYEFLDESILNSNYKVKLEGYLFPETYYFKTETTAEAVTYTFLNQFNVVYQSMKEDVKKSGKSLHEIITLASIVQFESSSVEDMKKVAGVFYNRLAINQKLESSVTICYSLYDYKEWEECERNSNIDSPYNTYKHHGLPIGPILNPGKQAIEATLNPTQHNYFYFIADVYGDNTVYYAETFEEHQKNVNKYLSQLK